MMNAERIRTILLHEHFPRLAQFVETGDISTGFDCKAFTAIYDPVYDICIDCGRNPGNGNAADMYELYQDCFQSHLKNTVVPMLRAKMQGERGLLFEWVRQWDNYKILVQAMRDMFMYLDRFHMKSLAADSNTTLDLRSRAFAIYHELVFREFAPMATDKLISVFDEPAEQRSHEVDLLRRSVSVYIELGRSIPLPKEVPVPQVGSMPPVKRDSGLALYKDAFEAAYTKALAFRCDRFAATWCNISSCTDYFSSVDRITAEELSLAEQCLHRTTLEVVRRLCTIHYVCQMYRHVLEKPTSGLMHLLVTNAMDDLKSIGAAMVKAMELEPQATAYLAETIARFVSEGARARIAAANHQQEQEQESGVFQLIHFHTRVEDVVFQCFNADFTVQKQVNVAWVDAINTTNRIIRQLARCAHELLKKNSRVASEAEREGYLQHIVQLYSYVVDKDIFEHDYHVLFAQRLLNRTGDEEGEKSMISRLKNACGYHWTNKLESMYKDVQLSRDIMRDYNALPESGAVSFSADICTSGVWPSKQTPSKSLKQVMPLNVQHSLDRFTALYHQKHAGRKLVWHLDQGEGEVNVTFNANTRRTLQVTTYQMMILNCFNSTKIVTYQTILDATGVQDAHLAHHLLSLCHPKVGVVLKKPNTKILEPSHQFMINTSFQNPMRRIVVPLLRSVTSAAAKDEADEATQKLLNLQRRHQIDASIVRILKSRKTLTHGTLMAEVIAQLSGRFKPPPAEIKHRIEALIDQEYLERDAKDRNTYVYKA